MKQFFTFLALCVSLACQAQLTPKMYAPSDSSKDVMFCFNRDQFRQITKLNAKGHFDALRVITLDSMIHKLESQLILRKQQIKLQSGEIFLLREQICERDTLIQAQSEYIALQKKNEIACDRSVQKLHKKVKNTRRIGVLLILVALLTGTQL